MTPDPDPDPPGDSGALVPSSQTDLEARMYPAMSEPAKPDTSQDFADMLAGKKPAVRSPGAIEHDAQQQRAGGVRTVDGWPELTTEEKMYPPDGGRPFAGDYGPALREGFDSLAARERAAGNAENLRILEQGKVLAASVLTDLGVGEDGAREISRSFARHMDNPLDTDPGSWQVVDANIECERQLRNLWRSEEEFRRNIGFAQLAFQEAAKRIPWLRQAANCGAGADPAVIRQFAAVGKRLAAQRARAAKAKK